MIGTETMRRIWHVGGALLGAAALLTLVALAPGRVGAGDGCTFVVAVNPDADDPGGTTLTVAPDVGGEVEVTFWGTFIPSAQVDLFFFFDGVPYGDFTPGTADAEGEFLFLHRFGDEDQGQWRVVASVAETECAGEVLVTVAAPGTTVPNTALPPAATRPGESPAISLALVGALLSVLILVPRLRRSR